MTDVILAANQYGKAENRVVRVARDTAPPRGRATSTSPRSCAATSRRPHRGRQQPGRRDRHPEEHDLRLREGRGRLAGGVPAAARRPLHRRLRLGDRRPLGGRAVRLGADRRPRPCLLPRRAGDPDRRRSCATATRTPCSSGFYGLTVMKTTGSGFVGYPKDKYTTLAETTTGSWPPTSPPGGATTPPTSTTTPSTRASSATILLRLPQGYSNALQQDLYEMGEAVIERHPRGRRDQVLLPQQAPLPVGPVVLRPGEPGRGVLRRRPSVRADRGHHPAQGRADADAAWVGVAGFC